MKNVKASIYGYIIGDTMGLPLKNKTRNELLKEPINQMLENEKLANEKGHWSSNTSLVLATFDSIIKNEKRINYSDIMRHYSEIVDNGKYKSSEIPAFGIGKTTLEALNNYHNNINPLECGNKKYENNDNESLARMLPVVLYCYYKKVEDNDIYSVVKKYSSLTHAHQLSVMACYIYVRYLLYILKGRDKYDAYKLVKCINYDDYFRKEIIGEYSRILNIDIKELKIEEIQSTSNVVDTLEAVLWVILNTKSYKQAIVGAINLGGDTNTIGALTGSIAGVLYGVDDIPTIWIDEIKNKELVNNIILNLVMQLY